MWYGWILFFRIQFSQFRSTENHPYSFDLCNFRLANYHSCINDSVNHENLRLTINHATIFSFSLLIHSPSWQTAQTWASFDKFDAWSQHCLILHWKFWAKHQYKLYYISEKEITTLSTYLLTHQIILILRTSCWWPERLYHMALCDIMDKFLVIFFITKFTLRHYKLHRPANTT